MNRIIEFDPFSLPDIRRAQREMEAYSQWVVEKANELVRRLAEIGANVAAINFSGGFIDGNDDVTITTVPLNDGYEVLANGQSVCFLEFGTGVAAGNGYDTTDVTPPVEIYPGSYSQTEGKGHFTEDHPYWWHDHKKYEMTTPRMGMYHAYSESRRQIEQVAREVFGS